jgi:hypothetical protein
MHTHRIGESLAKAGSRRRDADGGGRDDRAPKKVAHDSGKLGLEKWAEFAMY